MKESSDMLLIDQKEDIVWVTINRPGDRNSINSALIKSLEKMLKELEGTSVRAVVFCGAGDTHFIGGADGIYGK